MVNGMPESSTAQWGKLNNRRQWRSPDFHAVVKAIHQFCHSLDRLQATLDPVDEKSRVFYGRN
jgi:hypothetical protein